MSDGMWDAVVRRLRNELGRGPLTAAQAEDLYRDAPEEPLDASQIDHLVAVTIRRARQLTAESPHWHLWIGMSDGGGQRCITFHIAGIVGDNASVSQVGNRLSQDSLLQVTCPRLESSAAGVVAGSKTIRTPDWAVVSVSSLDVGSVDPVASPEDDAHAVCANTAPTGDRIDGVDWNEVYWEVTTPLPPRTHASTCIAGSPNSEKNDRASE